MTEQQHRATDLQWVCIRARASDNVAYSAILELRDRIEALEREAAMNELRAASSEARPTVKARITRDRDETGDYLIIHDASPNYPEIPDSSLERRVSEHIKAQSVLTAALVKRLEALEGVPLDGAKPAKVPGGLPALAEKVKALEVAHRGQPNHPEIPGGSLKERIKSRMIDTLGATWEVTAASILAEVAAWLSEHAGGTRAAWMLEREAER